MQARINVGLLFLDPKVGTSQIKNLSYGPTHMDALVIPGLLSESPREVLQMHTLTIQWFGKY